MSADSSTPSSPQAEDWISDRGFLVVICVVLGFWLAVALLVGWGIWSLLT